MITYHISLSSSICGVFKKALSRWIEEIATIDDFLGRILDVGCGGRTGDAGCARNLSKQCCQY